MPGAIGGGPKGPGAGAGPNGVGEDAGPNGISPPGPSGVRPGPGVCGAEPSGVKPPVGPAGPKGVRPGAGFGRGAGLSGASAGGADAGGLAGAGGGGPGEVPGAGALPPGMVKTALQVGQRPFLPPEPAGVRTTPLHWGQGNSMPVVAGEAGAWVAGVAAGICMTPWQCGHFPFFPAAASGALIRFRQFGQSNAMGMLEKGQRMRLASRLFAIEQQRLGNSLPGYSEKATDIAGATASYCPASANGGLLRTR